MKLTINYILTGFLLFIMTVFLAPVHAAAVSYTLTVQKAGTGDGTVKSSPAGINCGSVCSRLFVNNKTVTLTAKPVTGSQFSGWSGSCSGLSTCKVKMSQSHSVTATFTSTPKLTIQKSGQGLVKSTDNTVNCGSKCNQYFQANATVTLKATPTKGSYFAAWSGACSGVAGCTVTMSQSQSVKAVFIKTSSNKFKLKSNIGTVHGKYLTAGNAENLNKIVSAKSGFSEFLQKISNLILPQAHATIQACSTFVGHSGIENQSWDVINLVQTGTQTACVQQAQDAGRYVVLAPQNLQQSDGSPCDLVTIEKTSGNTTCIYLPLPNRATTGNPFFHLGIESNNFPGQLSLNGNYFFVSFYTGTWPYGNPGYVGHLRLDFTSAIPNSLITQLYYGTIGLFNAVQEVTVESGKTYSIFSELLPTENGDYIYTKTDQTDKSKNSSGVNIALVRDYTYVVVDSLQSDPSLQKTVLYIRSLNGADASTYGININDSPVGLWWKTQMQLDVADMSYGGQIIPNPTIASSSSELRNFYFAIFPVNYSDPICRYQIDQIIKATIVTATGEISFERIGPFGLGNGAGTHRLTDDIFLSSDLSTYFSLYISANPPSGELSMLKRTNALSSSSCPYIETTIHSEPYSAGTISPQNGSFSYETGEGVFLLNNSGGQYGDANGYGFACDWNFDGCQFTSTSVILYYDKLNGTVTSVPLTPFNSIDYSLSIFIIASSITSDRLNVQILDATTRQLKYTADLTPTGFEGIIEYADPSALQTDVVSGF